MTDIDTVTHDLTRLADEEIDARIRRTLASETAPGWSPEVRAPRGDYEARLVARGFRPQYVYDAIVWVRP